MSLWHYTCRHSFDRIGHAGVLLPVRVLADPARLAGLSHDWNRDLIWLTDLDFPMRDALCLSSVTGCDRTTHRYRVVDESTAHPWLRFRRGLPAESRDLELAPGAMPMHWWVSREPVSVVFDPIAVMAS